MLDLFLTLIAVIACLMFLGIRAFRNFQGKGKGCGCSCSGSCSSNKAPSDRHAHLQDNIQKLFEQEKK